jgi:hypothetical protein
MRRLSVALLLLSVVVPAVYAQQSEKSTPKQHVIRVGVAEPLNQSSFAVSTRWGRDQIVRNLQGKKNDKKSGILIEAVALEATRKGDALLEAGQQRCDYVVLTKLINFSNSGGVSVGPAGVEATPPLLGNANPGSQMGMEFSIMRPGHPNAIADGRTAAPTASPGSAGGSEIGALEDNARQVASRVAHEIKEQLSGMD